MDKNKNPIKNKFIESIENDYNEYVSNESKVSFSNFNTSNIINPLIKLVGVFVIVLLFVSSINGKKSENIFKYIDKIEGTWIDEYDNHYEIDNQSFQMNSGIKSLPFYEGTIKNIVKTETGYKIIITGIQYELNTEEKTRKEEKELDLIFEIKNYTEEIQFPMIVNMNDKEFSILKVS